MTVHVEGYLTEKKLHDALKDLIPSRDWLGCQVGLDETGLRRFKWDFGYVQNGQKVYIEFDGYLHYQNPPQISRDKRKDKLASERGIRTVRIPYFVQLTTITLRHFFDIDAQVNQEFQHGFITSTDYPSSFCELGQTRFLAELRSLPDMVCSDILKSLEARASDTQISQEFGREYVIPNWLEPYMSQC